MGFALILVRIRVKGPQVRGNTMNHRAGKTFRNCLKSIQAVLFIVISASATASDTDFLKNFNPAYKIKTRQPQSFIVDTDLTEIPSTDDSFLEKVFVEDDSGVLVTMRKRYEEIIENDEFISNWDVKFVGMYTESTQEDRVGYFNKTILKYFDKRLSGEVKKAEEGSTLATMGAVQNALKPTTKVNFSKNVRVKFKAQVLQGYAAIQVENPYVDYVTTVTMTGDLKMNLEKNFKDYRTIASVEYNVNESNYITAVDKLITDTLKARVSSSQNSSNAIFTQESDSRFQLIYSSPFNY